MRAMHDLKHIEGVFMHIFTERIKSVFSLFNFKNEMIFIYLELKYVTCLLLIIFRFYKCQNMTNRKNNTRFYPLSLNHKFGLG